MTTDALPVRQATPELSALAQALSALKLDRAADALPTLLSSAVSDDLSGPAFLQRVLAMELTALVVQSRSQQQPGGFSSERRQGDLKASKRGIPARPLRHGGSPCGRCLSMCEITWIAMRRKATR